MLTDRYHRQFSYLRLSLTPVCNFRCQYCLPNGNPEDARFRNPLSTDEILRLVRAFAGLGMTKIRLTGGEPTLRPDFLDIASQVAQVDGVDHVALTTNGYRLNEDVALYRDAGIHTLNVSVDSLNPTRFERITRSDKLPSILEGIRKAQRLGFRRIKINAVLLKDLNDGDFFELVDWAADSGLEMRFIELMRTGDNILFYKKHYCDLAPFKDALEERGWTRDMRVPTAGPADVYSHPQGLCKVGFIRPSMEHFCDTCNRLRVSFQGELQLCLFGNGRVSLRPFLQHDSDIPRLQQYIQQTLAGKDASHHLQEGDYGITRNLASIGG